tara:strand:- start:15076 stop:16002 length:927 start_codon:yes stop_codon:yes gene_type:complete
MKKIYYWACDISQNSGEGILANLFLKDYLTKNKESYFKNINLKNKNQKKNNFFNNAKKFNSIYHKYLFPYIGIFYLWVKFLQSKKTCYINYLPLWNFIIFLTLPPKTILGPITGTAFRTDYSYIFNFLEKISLLIIKIRFEKVIFSTDFYIKKYSLNKKKFIGNFILQDFVYKKNRQKKKYDLVIYYRKNSKLKKEYIYEIIKNLKKYKYKIAIIGDQIKIHGNKNFGYLQREKVKKIISMSKFAISNPENLYSFFVQDCLSNNLLVFYNNFFRKFNKLNKKNLIPITFKNTKKDLKIILEKTKKKFN